MNGLQMKVNQLDSPEKKWKEEKTIETFIKYPL